MSPNDIYKAVHSPLHCAEVAATHITSQTPVSHLLRVTPLVVSVGPGVGADETVEGGAVLTLLGPQDSPIQR